MLSLWGDATAFKLPDRLPDLPSSSKEAKDIEAQAMQHRLDVQMAKRHAETTASALGLSKATGFINVLHAGYANVSETGSPRANGYEIELELPIFDWGRSRTAKITLKHGELKNLDMLAMTMVFQVKDKAMLDRVKTGDKVSFIADKIDGKFTITQIEAKK